MRQLAQAKKQVQLGSDAPPSNTHTQNSKRFYLLVPATTTVFSCGRSSCERSMLVESTHTHTNALSRSPQLTARSSQLTAHSSQLTAHGSRQHNTAAL